MTAVADAFPGFRPCLILAHAEPAYAAAAARAFRRHGWDVYTAGDGPEVRRLTRMLEPQLIVLQADLPGESGWLTCEKLTGQWPSCKVVLVAADPAPTLAAFASFVGAEALIGRNDGPSALLPRLRRPALPAVG